MNGLSRKRHVSIFSRRIFRVAFIASFLVVLLMLVGVVAAQDPVGGVTDDEEHGGRHETPGDEVGAPPAPGDQRQRQDRRQQPEPCTVRFVGQCGQVVVDLPVPAEVGAVGAGAEPHADVYRYFAGIGEPAPPL